jgi:hypothetical protein
MSPMSSSNSRRRCSTLRSNDRGRYSCGGLHAGPGFACSRTSKPIRSVTVQLLFRLSRRSPLIEPVGPSLIGCPLSRSCCAVQVPINPTPHEPTDDAEKLPILFCVQEPC